MAKMTNEIAIKVLKELVQDYEVLAGPYAWQNFPDIDNKIKAINRAIASLVTEDMNHEFKVTLNQDQIEEWCSEYLERVAEERAGMSLKDTICMQIPLRPDKSGGEYKCSNCGSFIPDERPFGNKEYCRKCGQAIGWSNE